MKEIGRTETGRDLVSILKRAKSHYSSIHTIDKNRDTNAQVEGRAIFGEFIDNLTTAIETKTHQVRPREVDDFT